MVTRVFTRCGDAGLNQQMLQTSAFNLTYARAGSIKTEKRNYSKTYFCARGLFNYKQRYKMSLSHLKRVYLTSYLPIQAIP